ncbi:putative protein-(glutamine-N5) methyltransferase [Pseudonocardia sediminis]|uniref:Release factor glutamine methyltransferase n=1 Tax=Pseudonocardia sediminis TaxID=1397368 RepID=A0A4Q7UTL6_PSEST|nr:putative protein-(glutamine-N5) methyltransferase [Pseudonocardia sediminis]
MNVDAGPVVARLRAAGCVFAEDEAALLLEAAADEAALDSLVARRVEGLPLEHLLGWAEFGGLRIDVAPGVFVPRRRTEALVHEAVALLGSPTASPPSLPPAMPDRSGPAVRVGTPGPRMPIVVDLCCGAGAIGAAVASTLRSLHTGSSSTPGPSTPGPSTPGPSTPGPSTPGPATPGPAVPGAAVPGAAVPELAGPEPAVPGAAVPELAVPELAAPGSVGPESAVPGAAVSGWAGPESAGPGGVPIELHAAEIDPAAVACARRNLAPFRGHVYEGDLDAPLPAELRGRVSVLVANVPYVPTDAIATMPPEARDHEPRVALDGGADGLDVARRVAAAAPGWLAPGGSLLIETGREQSAVLAGVFTAHGLRARVVEDDDLGSTVVIGTRPGPLPPPHSG